VPLLIPDRRRKRVSQTYSSTKKESRSQLNNAIIFKSFLTPPIKADSSLSSFPAYPRQVSLFEATYFELWNVELELRQEDKGEDHKQRWKHEMNRAQD
jgi:hypothetical protein